MWCGPSRPKAPLTTLANWRFRARKATLEATTRFDRFAILVTAEPHYMVDKPGSGVVYKNESARDFPGVPLTVEVGAYEYANLPENHSRRAGAGDGSPCGHRDRDCGAGRPRADSEFRQAKVALDTMEELVRRGFGTRCCFGCRARSDSPGAARYDRCPSKRSIERLNPRHDLSNIELLHTPACRLDQAVSLRLRPK